MLRRSLLVVLLVIANLRSLAVSANSTNQLAAHPIQNPTEGWKQEPVTFEVQHPYDLDLKERYKFDSASNTHDFWVFFTDKPHAPPPNRTTARTEMRLETFSSGEHMFDADVNIKPGTFACIGQVFDAKHGPVTMIIAHPDGTVTIGGDQIKTNAIGKWWNLKVSNDTSPGGKIRVYVDNVLVATYASRGPRDYYFKCGVYSRKDSTRSEVLVRNIKMWVKWQSPGKQTPT